MYSTSICHFDELHEHVHNDPGDKERHWKCFVKFKQNIQLEQKQQSNFGIAVIRRKFIFYMELNSPLIPNIFQLNIVISFYFQSALYMQTILALIDYKKRADFCLCISTWQPIETIACCSLYSCYQLFCDISNPFNKNLTVDYCVQGYIYQGSQMNTTFVSTIVKNMKTYVTYFVIYLETFEHP